MAITKNPVWRFLASVKLALVSLIILAAVSIIGTLIKQGQPADFYVEEYGQQLAGLFEQFGFTSMYSSWWFTTLLGLFAVNLIVCSIERLPAVWRQVSSDNLDIAPASLEKMNCCHQVDTGLAPGAAAEAVRKVLAEAGWKNPGQMERDETMLLAAQKGAWTRFGVYVVHLSILVILVGAMIGSLSGYQAYVFIPEGTSSSNIFLRKDKSPVPLGYELQCDWFEKTFYPNGMIRQYRADLSVIDPRLPAPIKKSVTVNDPLSYRGLTFFVGDGFPMDEYLLQVSNKATGAQRWFRVAPEQTVDWPEESVTFRIEELAYDEEGNALRARLSFMLDPVAPETSWLDSNRGSSFGLPGREYVVSYRQLNSTLLLITKDPGVVTVYLGFCMMVVGLAISFFLSHRRIWVHVAPSGKTRVKITVAGSSNKHKPAFSRHFDGLVEKISQDDSLSRRIRNK